MAAYIHNGNKDDPLEIGDDYLKIVVVGEPRVGKTTFIQTLTRFNFPEEVTSINGTRIYRFYFEICNKLRRIAIYEIPSHPDFLWQHKFLHYDKAHVFVFMYAIDDPASFHRLSTRWLPETMPVINTKALPVALIGNKRDLRDNSQVNPRLAANYQEFVTPEQTAGFFGLGVYNSVTVEVSSGDEYEVLQAFRNISSLFIGTSHVQLRSKY